MSNNRLHRTCHTRYYVWDKTDIDDKVVRHFNTVINVQTQFGFYSLYKYICGRHTRFAHFSPIAIFTENIKSPAAIIYAITCYYHPMHLLKTTLYGMCHVVYTYNICIANRYNYWFQIPNIMVKFRWREYTVCCLADK